MSHLNQSKTLESLSNVNITNAINNDILQYDSTSLTWKNKPPSASITSLNDLSDVTINSPINNQILQYNGSTWVNTASVTPTYTNTTNRFNKYTSGLLY